MSQTVLAQGVVEFVATGQEKVAKAQASIMGGLMKWAATAGKLVAAVPAFAVQMFQRAAAGIGNFCKAGIAAMGDWYKRTGDYLEQLGAKFKSFALLASAGIGGFVAAATYGTVEGERLALAFKMLIRVLGDQLAPFIRMTTANVIMLARYIGHIDKSTRFWATAVLMAVSAMASLYLVANQVYGILSPLAGAIVKLISTFVSLGVSALVAMGPIGIAIGILGALGAAIAVLFNPFESWAELNEWVGETLEAVWGGIQAAWAGLMVGIQTGWAQYGATTLEALQAGWAAAYAYLAPIIQGLTQFVLNFFGSGAAEGISFAGVVSVIFEAFADVWGMVSNVAQALWGEMVPAFEAIGQAATYLYETILSPIFGKIADLWKWLTDGISFTWKDCMKFLGDTLLGVVVVIAQIINGVYWAISNVISGIVKTLAWLGEKTSVISKATADSMREFSKTITDGSAIDVDKLTERMGAASAKLGGDLAKNKEIALGVKDGVNQAMAGIKVPGFNGVAVPAPKVPKITVPKLPEFKIPTLPEVNAKGLTPKTNSTLEGIGGTFDRLLTSFATNPGMDIQKSTLNAIEQGNELQARIAENTGKIALVGD